MCSHASLTRRQPPPVASKTPRRHPDQIAALWDRHPAPLIGIACGAVSGIAVLDIDTKHDEARAWWFRNEHRIPETRSYRTRSGGFHLYFQYEPGLRCASSRPVLGVDVRGDGGYAVFWFADGHECLDHNPPTQWPSWLTSAIWPPLKLYPAPITRPLTFNGTVDGLLHAVSEAPEGKRNSVLYWAAHRMREHITDGDIDRSEAEHRLVVAARDCGLTEPEALQTIGSAWRTTCA